MTFSKNPAALEPTISPRGKRWFVILLALAASVRLYPLWRYYCISSDGVVYLRAAKDFYAGDIAGALASVSPRVVHVRNYGYGGNQKPCCTRSAEGRGGYRRHAASRLSINTNTILCCQVIGILAINSRKGSNITL